MSPMSAFASPARFDTAGTLDTSFADNGRTHVYFADSLFSVANSIATDSRGGILVAAKVGTAGGSCFGLARLLADGSSDLAFGNQGSVIGQFEAGFEAMAAKVCVLPNGQILLAGLHYENAHRTLPALALFDQHGALVRSFGDNGHCLVRLPGNLSDGARDTWLPPGSPGAEACAVCIQSDGRILLLANHYFERADHAGLLIRLNADGTLDSAFNGRGFVVIRHLLMNTWLCSLMIQDDGRILVGGTISFPEAGLVARVQSDGTLDEHFAANGFMSFSSGGRSAQVSHIVQLKSGDLQCFGSSREPSQCLSLKLHSSGRTDRQCNSGQAQQLDMAPIGGQWNAACTLSDGRVLVVGTTPRGPDADFLMACYLPSGQLDPHFGEGCGWVRSRWGRRLQAATSVAIQPDGGIIVGGYTLDGNYRAVIARYLG